MSIRSGPVSVSDITYIPSQQEGWLYLAGELDLCSRRLVGWKLGASLSAPLVMDAFERAVQNWSTLPSLHHSDRGVQYVSSDFRRLLNSYEVEPSMSRKGNCYDNAVMESFSLFIPQDGKMGIGMLN